MKFDECDSILAEGGAVTCPALRGAIVVLHEDKKRHQIIYPKGHPKYPKGTFRLFEEDGNEKAIVSSEWEKVTPKEEG
jgi:hypothetical protein